MDKNYVYTGMIVNYCNQKHLILEKKSNTCDLFNCNGGFKVCNIPYTEVNGYYSDDIKEYNRNIKSVHCKSSSRLDKSNNQSYIFNDGSRVWFTSDTHFSHDNIIKFCKRPYDDIYTMNEDIIGKWNSLIDEDDTVFHLGDFSYGGSKEWVEVLSRLHGHIHLILGNHDIKNIRQNYHKYFESISSQQLIEVEGQKIYLNHYPFLTYAGIYRREEDTIWQLFGHMHSSNNSSGMDSGRLQHLLPTQYDVGVDNNNFKPVNYNEIKNIIRKQVKNYKNE